MRTSNFITKILIFGTALSCLFMSCERTNINFSEPDLIKRLQSFLGENKNEVSRQMKQDGYQVINDESTTNYIKNPEQYAVAYNKDKVIYGAAYMLAEDSLAVIQKRHEEWKLYSNDLDTKNYTATIMAENFLDISHGYVDSLKTSDATYWIYDDEIKFNAAYVANKSNVTYLNEVWYDDSVKTMTLSLEYSFNKERPFQKGHNMISLYDNTLN